jgi:hypothetical protein
MDKAIMVGGKLTDVHESAVDAFVLKDSKWFTANYNEAVEVLKLVHKDYDKFLEKSEALRIENSEKFSMEAMKEEFKKLIQTVPSTPKQTQLVLPKLTKIN